MCVCIVCLPSCIVNKYHCEVTTQTTKNNTVDLTGKWWDDRVKGQSWVPEAVFVSLLWRSDADSARRTQNQIVQRPSKLVDARRLARKQHAKTTAHLDTLTFNWRHVTSDLWTRLWCRRCGNNVLRLFCKHIHNTPTPLLTYSRNNKCQLN